MSVKGEVTKLKIAGAKIWTKLGNSPERHGGKSRGKYCRKINMYSNPLLAYQLMSDLIVFWPILRARFNTKKRTYVFCETETKHITNNFSARPTADKQTCDQ